MASATMTIDLFWGKFTNFWRFRGGFFGCGRIPPHPAEMLFQGHHLTVVSGYDTLGHHLAGVRYSVDVFYVGVYLYQV